MNTTWYLEEERQARAQRYHDAVGTLLAKMGLDVWAEDLSLTLTWAIETRDRNVLD